MADTLETLEIEVKHKATGAAGEISSVSNALHDLYSQIARVLPSMKELAREFGNLAKSAGKVKIDINFPTMPEMAQQQNPLTTPVDEKKWAEDMAAKIESPDPGFLGSVKEALFGITSESENAKEGLKGVAQVLTESATADAPIANVKTQLKGVSTAAHEAKKAAKEAGKGIREAAEEASKSKSPFENLISSFKRIAFYRFIRSVIKEITQSFKEGLQGAYTFSNGISGQGHRFAEAMDSMTSASYKMKGQLGSAFISLLAIIAPIVNTILSLITRLANALSQLFAVFTGGTYLKATDNSIDYADTFAKSAGGAAKAADEWKNQILGFDEINRLEAPSDGGGGGGGGGGMPDLASFFEDTPIDGIFKKIKEKLDELKESMDFTNLIKAWEHLKEAVSNFADIVLRVLAWAWENILVPLAHWVIEEAAPRMVEILANAFDLLNAVLERLRPVFEWVWENVLKPIANWIGDRFLDFLDTVNSLLLKLIDLVKGNTSFKEFLDSLSTGETILLALAAAFVIVNGAILIFSGITALIGAVGAAIAALASPVGIAIAAITALIVAGIELYKHWEEIVEWFSNLFERLKEAFVNKFNEYIEACRTFVNGVIQMFRGLIEFISGIFANSWKQAWAGIVNFFKGIENAIRGIIQNIIAMIHSLINTISNIGSGISAIRSSGSVRGYATGGFPDTGEIFVAREGAPEMVGTIGGRTAVATNNDIVAAVSRGVYEAVYSAMGSGSNSNKGSVVLNINGREFARAIYDDQRAVNREHGTRLVNNA